MFTFQVKTEDYLGVDFELKLHLENKERRPTLPLTLEHTEGVFFILLLGWSLSGVLFAKETLYRPRST